MGSRFNPKSMLPTKRRSLTVNIISSLRTMVRLPSPSSSSTSLLSLLATSCLLLRPFCFSDALATPVSRRVAVSDGMLLAGSSLLLLPPSPAIADDAAVQEKPAGSALETLTQRTRGIPTFCIVNPDNGASYMVFQRTIAIGYAFLTFEGAFAVLQDAQATAKEGGYFDIWEKATITTIPLDAAIRLSLRKRERLTPKDQSLESVVRVIPGAGDRADAIALDKRFDQQGRVPLFYVDEDRTDDDVPLTVYFSRRDLIRDWAAAHPGEGVVPKIKVLDLETIFTFASTGREKEIPARGNIRFVPMEDSLLAAKELTKRGLSPYNPKRMIV